MTSSLLSKNCKLCDKLFYKSSSCSIKNWQKRSNYCSKRCANTRPRFRGESPVASNINHGITGYNSYGCRCDICREATRLRKRDHRARKLIPREQWGLKENLNPAWKGDDVSYVNMHVWVNRHKKKNRYMRSLSPEPGYEERACYSVG